MADIDTDKVTKSDSALREENILEFWKDNQIFEKSLKRGSEKNTFVFYEGPPTANGRPGVHHMESRSFKDAIPRYKTMRGFRVPRRAGWDTHGLPVEIEVEKQLGFSGKKDIESYGIAAFNKKCRESVFNYIHEWERFSERLGYWADQKRAYFTFNVPYMESLFSIMKKVDADGRLYKDYKVLPWCPVCGTALSSHELAQGYEEVKDLSLTVKFELVDEPGTFFLAWTTTPWTLPGNVALAVGPSISYGVYEHEGSKYILAEALAEKHGFQNPSKKMLGEELIGKSYKPLYAFAKDIASESEKPKFENAFKVHPADFVTTEDGTGIVHTAVMYGQDDFELGQKLNLPKVHLVAPDGKFIAGTGFLEGASVIDAETNVAVLKDLQEKGLFFSKENYAHTYPHCWRSKNRLIYYARDSWYIRMTELRDELIRENKKVAWEPSYLRDGRMGEWLLNVRDWAISRERYWGTPLPIWQTKDGSEKVVIGSIEELKQRTKRSGNRYLLMRHGESDGNKNRYFDSDGIVSNELTEKGRAQVEASTPALKKAGITKIYASPLLRTEQTAEIVAERLGIPKENIIYDVRLQELNFGEYGGVDNPGAHDAYWEWKGAHHYKDKVPGGESYFDAKCRFGSFLYEMERSFAGENILIVTHGIAFESAEVLLAGADEVAADVILKNCLSVAKNAEVMELPFVPLPHNDDYELDLHRPYIDDIVLISDSGKEMLRVPEVMDVWFDSGAMPFAQDHYPFENKKWVDTKGYPADYISEAIDQTRGWFYTLLAVGVLMGKGRAYKNVISLGHLLDDKGLKMSKSKGNIIEPMAAMDRYGADTLRFWMYSVNQPGDSKNFDDKTVKEAARVISWFENSVKFYELFKDVPRKKGKEQVLDVWMRSRTSETIQDATKALDAYDFYTATRSISSLVEDLSQWYVRRVRDRVREGDTAALETLHQTLEAISLLLAPFTPFVSEWAYQILRSPEKPESVHLADWPKAGRVDVKLEGEMETLRALASEGLRMRQSHGIKVSQPLASFSIPEKFSRELAELLAEELNVKEVFMKAEEKKLDVVLTPELIALGDERTFGRAVAEARKAEDLSPQDKVRIEKHAEGKYKAELSTGTVHFSLIHDAT